jgi:hypothetical protein
LSLKGTAVDDLEVFSCEIPMSTLASKRIRLREAMTWVGCAAVLFAALRADTFVTVLILAFPLRLALIARYAGLGVARGECRAAILPSWVAFSGDETDERRFARGLGLSLFVDALLVGLWPVWREVALDVGLLATNPWAQANISKFLQEWRTSARDLAWWKRLWAWEAWSLGRWWLLFGLLAIATTPLSRRARPRAEAAIRLLRFSPWLIVLEFGYLVGVWIARGKVAVVPEPSTMFASEWGFRKYGILVYFHFWLIRGGLSSFVVGLAFFRIVPGWRWVEAILGSLALVPVAVGLSMFWSVVGGPLWMAHNWG